MKDFAISVLISTTILSMVFIGLAYCLSSRFDGIRALGDQGGIVLPEDER